MMRRHLLLFVLTLALPLLFPGRGRADALTIDTDYRLRGISYPNTDFDQSTSSDSLAYYSQRLQVSIIGRFDSGIEIGSKITALGVVGSTSTPFPVPYPNTDFAPFIENAYVRISSPGSLPIFIAIGKQNLQYGDGLIVSDNGVGFNALRLGGSYSVPLGGRRIPLGAEIFTAKIRDNLRPGTDQDLYGGVLNTTWKQFYVELGYFSEMDNSGSLFVRSSTSTTTKAIAKQYYDFRIGRKEAVSSYQFEIAKQGGYVTTAAGNTINLGGLGYILSGELIGEKTKLGRVRAHALISAFTGDSSPGTLSGDDNAFQPTFTRRYDGIERVGYGELFAASPYDSFFTAINPTLTNPFLSYSGIDTLNLGAVITPMFNLDLGVDYFLYSASQGPAGAPVASGIERLYGAEFALGVELDLYAKYVFSKYFEGRLSFSRYTPPNYVLWPKRDPASRYQLDLSTRF